MDCKCNGGWESSLSQKPGSEGCRYFIAYSGSARGGGARLGHRLHTRRGDGICGEGGSPHRWKRWRASSSFSRSLSARSRRSSSIPTGALLNPRPPRRGDLSAGGGIKDKIESKKRGIKETHTKKHTIKSEEVHLVKYYTGSYYRGVRWGCGIYLIYMGGEFCARILDHIWVEICGTM